MGLRESKKLATRHALSTSALQLALENGADCVTAEGIADAAGVSVRTFFNYFPTKEAAFVADDLERGHAFVARVAAAPADAPVWELLRRTALEVFAADEQPSREQALKEQLVRSSPAVLAQVLATYARLEQELVVELTRRTGTGALRAHLMAGAVATAARAAAETWLGPAPRSASFGELLDEAFAVLAPAFTS